ncbi:hypothetical protein H4219_003679 [Mycoemilia scoparia]|uniref:WIBG Mago-binding domain-containing protein n=1 Tax=Mycoemilia scoparia TaxID=417184 RepID=A0A9W7ZUV2_9FUNG|nr:hypothetical protein H4219_003679 [Mycoemilia scoparia]
MVQKDTRVKHSENVGQMGDKKSQTNDKTSAGASSKPKTTTAGGTGKYIIPQHRKAATQKKVSAAAGANEGEVGNLTRAVVRLSIENRSKHDTEADKVRGMSRQNRDYLPPTNKRASTRITKPPPYHNKDSEIQKPLSSERIEEKSKDPERDKGNRHRRSLSKSPPPQQQQCISSGSIDSTIKLISSMNVHDNLRHMSRLSDQQRAMENPFSNTTIQKLSPPLSKAKIADEMTPPPRERPSRDTRTELVPKTPCERVIPASVRADGSVRKERRIRANYISPEEKPRYIPPAVIRKMKASSDKESAPSRPRTLTSLMKDNKDEFPPL